MGRQGSMLGRLDGHRGYVRSAAVLLPAVVGWLLHIARGGVEPGVSERGALPAGVAMLCLVVVVVAIATTGDRAAGLLASVAAALSFDFFFTVPYVSFAIYGQDDIVLALLMIAVGAAVTELAIRGQRQRAEAARRGSYLAGVLETSDQARLGGDEHAFTCLVAQRIASVLGAERCTFETYDAGYDVALLGRDGLARTGTGTIDVLRQGLPTDRYSAIPAGSGAPGSGHYRISSGSRVTRPTIEQLTVALLLAEYSPDSGSR